MSLLVVGCNHRSAPIELRERLAFDARAAAAALERFGAARPQAEAVLLSTCNRTEVYVASVVEKPEADWVLDLFEADRDQLALHLYTYTDAEAVEHLFRVASSLDSMVVGEVQIIAQVKQAYALSGEQGAAGPLLNALFQRALRVAKTIHATTGIGRARVSISSLAVEFARRVFDRFDDKTVLMVGAGKMGALAVEQLTELAPGRTLVVNRSPAKAEALARRFRGEARPWDELADALVDSDVVISCTSSAEPIATAEQFGPIAARRAGRPLFIVDIAVPRDFDPAIGDADNVYLYNIDDLDKVRQENLARRQGRLDRCLRLVRKETEAFMADMASQETAPVIVKLTEQLGRIREAELERLANKLGDGLTDDQRRQIAYTLERLQRKFMHPTVLAMKEEVAGGRGGHPFLDAVRRLLGMSE